MDEFKRLELELGAPPQGAYVDYTASCLDSEPLLDDRAAGNVHPTGERLPSLQPVPNETEDFLPIFKDPFGSAMSERGSIILASSELDDSPLHLELNCSEDSRWHLAVPNSVGSTSTMQAISMQDPTAPQAPSVARPPTCASGASPTVTSSSIPEGKTIGSNWRQNFVNISNMNNNELFDKVTDVSGFWGEQCQTMNTRAPAYYGNASMPMLGYGLGHADMPSLGCVPHVKEEDHPHLGPDSSESGRPARRGVTVTAVPPPVETKKTSTCKVTSDKVYVKLGHNFRLKFCGSPADFEDSDVRLEVTYEEPDSMDTPVLACHDHWVQHQKSCEASHGENTFMCTGGQVPIFTKCENKALFKPLMEIVGQRLQPKPTGQA